MPRIEIPSLRIPKQVFESDNQEPNINPSQKAILSLTERVSWWTLRETIF
jgi:hypothetical protein